MYIKSTSISSGYGSTSRVSARDHSGGNKTLAHIQDLEGLASILYQEQGTTAPLHCREGLIRGFGDTSLLLVLRGGQSLY